MVYVDPRDLGVQPAIDSWLAAHPVKSQSEALLKLFASIAVPLARLGRNASTVANPVLISTALKVDYVQRSEACQTPIH